MKIYLCSEKGKNDYEINASVVDRQDVLSAFCDTKNIQGRNLGFICKFSATDLPDSDYEVFVFCHENDEAEGLSSLNKYIRVTDGVASILEPEA